MEFDWGYGATIKREMSAFAPDDVSVHFTRVPLGKATAIATASSCGWGHGRRLDGLLEPIDQQVDLLLGDDERWRDLKRAVAERTHEQTSLARKPPRLCAFPSTWRSHHDDVQAHPAAPD